MAQMESKTLRELVSILMSDARHEIAKQKMAEETWDNILDIITVFENKLDAIYKAYTGD